MVQDSSRKAKTSKLDTDPDAIYRIINLHYYIFILLIVGIPVWWMTTRVYRADLPLKEMNSIILPKTSDKPFGILLSLEYDILITIVNPLPQDLNVKIDGELLELNLRPFLNKLSPVADFVVKSQWTYLTDLGIKPQKKGDEYVVNESQLYHIVTPLEKESWSFISNRTCINLMLYIAPCSAPMYLYDNSKNRLETNAFVSPRWGGVYFLNPDSKSCQKHVYEPDYESIIRTFVNQLMHLYHLDGFSESAMNKFKFNKAKEMLDATKHTLKSLAQLLYEINSIVIRDDVAEKVIIALGNMTKAEKYLEEDNISEGLKHAKVAFKNSESAFADPSLLALLYFPDDQKYAIYIPLFLPIMIPVFMSLTHLRKWYKEHIHF
ncbi:GPI transamidase component PIG-S [Agrilus planipennis]|uniref:GPI transamidase component PIG-S n=1 Tax=Agrilus planipennis TaxID=224129 RepID=A0A1W4WPC1_AGRPL|nr:GPI transamidase component PIG-S [Agrilus planipennis]